jgi:hypothetical protein
MSNLQLLPGGNHSPKLTGKHGKPDEVPKAPSVARGNLGAKASFSE